MRNHLIVFIAAALYGTIGVIVKLTGTEIPIMTLNFYRVFFAFIFLLLFVPLIDKNTFKVTKKDLKDYFIIGLILAVSISLYNISYFLAPVQSVALINSIVPFFVLIFAYFLLKEKITKTKIITFVIALIGLAIINPFDFSSSGLGSFIALIHAAVYGLLITEMRKEDKTHSIGDVVWFFFFASILLLPALFIFGAGNILEVLPLVLFLGVLSTGLAYLLYNLALEKIQAETASIIETIGTPLMAIALAVIIINESLNFQTVIGGAILIIAAIYLETHRKQLKQ